MTLFLIVCAIAGAAGFVWLDYLIFKEWVEPLLSDHALTKRILWERRDQGVSTSLLKWSQVDAKPKTRTYRRWEYVELCEDMVEPWFAAFGLIVIGGIQVFILSCMAGPYLAAPT